MLRIRAPVAAISFRILLASPHTCGAAIPPRFSTPASALLNGSRRRVSKCCGDTRAATGSRIMTQSAPASASALE
jgi:hypothetical protein